MPAKLTSVLCSGLDTGPSPSAGLAIARCVRDAFPRLRLTGVEYSARVGGIHDPVFDDVMVQRPWGELDLNVLAAQVADRIEAGTAVLSANDLEAYWLAHQFPDRPEVLVPPPRAFDSLIKPYGELVETLGVKRPASMPVSAPADDLHGFLRRYGWASWIKGPIAEARRVGSWERLASVREELRRYWPHDDFHVQQDIVGFHESIAFCAFQGALIDALWIVKNDMTKAGKTLSGSVRDMPAAMCRSLSAFVNRLGWHGGGEVELVRDHEGVFWVTDVNLRFPVWAHGAAFVGHNLPAMLLERLTGSKARRGATHGGFVRVYIDVPTRPEIPPLPPFCLVPGEDLDAGKYSASALQIAEKLDAHGVLPRPVSARLSPVRATYHGLPEEDLIAADGLSAPGTTPRWVRLKAQADRRIGAFLSACRDGDEPLLVPAYSVKTNPDRWVLELMQRHRIALEVISREELALARSLGPTCERIIVNGPGKLRWLMGALSEQGDPKSISHVYADSLEELGRTLASPLPADVFNDVVLGLRVKPGGVGSRFGISFDDLNELARTLDLLRQYPAGASFGLHLHVSRAVIGERRWRSLVSELVQTASRLERLAGRTCVALDFGGGGYPDDLIDTVRWLRAEVGPTAHRELPNLELLFIEPGRALVQDWMAVTTTVLEVRHREGRTEIVVDASIACLSEAGHFPHRILRRGPTEWASIPSPGSDRVLGPTCMEADVLAEGIQLPADIAEGDALLVLDAGAYDRSMAYDFAKG